MPLSPVCYGQSPIRRPLILLVIFMFPIDMIITISPSKVSPLKLTLPIPFIWIPVGSSNMLYLHDGGFAGARVEDDLSSPASSRIFRDDADAATYQHTTGDKYVLVPDVFRGDVSIVCPADKMGLEVLDCRSVIEEETDQGDRCRVAVTGRCFSFVARFGIEKMAVSYTHLRAHET